jgi:hypothetical protein
MSQKMEKNLRTWKLNLQENNFQKKFISKGPGDSGLFFDNNFSQSTQRFRRGRRDLTTSLLKRTLLQPPRDDCKN